MYLEVNRMIVLFSYNLLINLIIFFFGFDDEYSEPLVKQIVLSISKQIIFFIIGTITN